MSLAFHSSERGQGLEGVGIILTYKDKEGFSQSFVVVARDREMLGKLMEDASEQDQKGIKRAARKVCLLPI